MTESHRRRTSIISNPPLFQYINFQSIAEILEEFFIFTIYETTFLPTSKQSFISVADEFVC